MNADLNAPSAADTPPTFDTLPLTPEVRRAIDEMGFRSPTPVQLAAYEPAAAGSDLIVQARTGTGKTAAFGLPLVDRRVRSDAGQQVLILAPTRELALQSAREIERLGQHRGIRVVPVYGGAPMEKQVRELEGGAQIVSGTPGRVLDHLRRGTLCGEDIRVLVLDEADEMLSMGFAKELNAIVELLPKSRQTMLFSATMDDAVLRLAGRFLKDPVSIALSSDAVGALTITHYVYMLSGIGKSRDLIRILESEDPESAIIFCNTKAVTEQVAAELQQAGFQADWLNGDLPQSDREKVLAATRKGELRYLVATDVAARGIDISHLTHVINYDFPEQIEAYVHRTGRTGRAGKTGTAISLVLPQDLGSLYYVRLSYKIFPIERTLPSVGELKTRKELDRIDLLRDAFAERSGPTGPGADDLAIARRLLVHDDGERIVAGLLHAFFGGTRTSEDVDEQASAARRARAAKPVADAPTAEAPKSTPRAPGARRPEPRRETPAPRVEAQPPRVEAQPQASEETAGDRGPRRRRRERDGEAATGDASPRLDGDLARPAPESAGEPSGVADAATATPRAAPRARAERPSRGEARRDHGADADVQAPSGDPHDEQAEGGRSSAAPHEPDPNVSTLFVNLGRRDGIRVLDILRLFEAHTGLGKDALGRIRIRDRHTFVGVPKDSVEQVLAELAGKTALDRPLVVEVARAEAPVLVEQATPSETA